MNFFISASAELIKIKRSASLWICFLGAGFIPLIFFLNYALQPERNLPRLVMFPWAIHFGIGWQAFSSFLLPMFIILICSLIPQIEFKNNAWKQVFASPQPLTNIFFSKFFIIIMIIVFLFVLFNFFLAMSAILANLIVPKYGFLKSHFDLVTMWKLNWHIFLSVMGMIAFQYLLSLRFKNFIAAVGIGLALLIASLVAIPFWDHADTLPYAYPMLTMRNFASKTNQVSLPNHEIYSVLYFIGFTLLAFLDMKYRKERG
ncbi:MAG TPA: ABC transporter permease [Chitinophagaceae bacterium]|nr:ABC transporter permease [Chitinophagaceae bacterium]